MTDPASARLYDLIAAALEPYTDQRDTYGALPPEDALRAGVPAED